LDEAMPDDAFGGMRTPTLQSLARDERKARIFEAGQRRRAREQGRTYAEQVRRQRDELAPAQALNPIWAVPEPEPESAPVPPAPQPQPVSTRFYRPPIVPRRFVGSRLASVLLGAALIGLLVYLLTLVDQRIPGGP
jgi:hypothetical protein